MSSAIGLTVAAFSDTGRVRKNNEDAAYVGLALYAVADGMGGHAAGEIASAAVIGSLRQHDNEVPPDELLGTLSQAVTNANADLASAAAEDPARRGMGTTLAAMLWSGNRFALANIGDSRAFRLRAGQLEQMTEDHVMDKLVSNAGGFAPVLSRYLDGRPDRSPLFSAGLGCFEAPTQRFVAGRGRWRGRRGRVPRRAAGGTPRPGSGSCQPAASRVVTFPPETTSPGPACSRAVMILSSLPAVPRRVNSEWRSGHLLLSMIGT
jgi:hypothetical protein